MKSCEYLTNTREHKHRIYAEICVIEIITLISLITEVTPLLTDRNKLWNMHIV